MLKQSFLAGDNMENDRICVIFSGSPELGIPCEPIPEQAYILCADSGLRLAERLNRKPDLVLGDFDSLGAEPEHLPHITAPVEKDDTDTMLAVRTALANGFRDIRIYGAFGGRLDHTFANLQTLEYIRKQGADGILCGIRDSARMVCGGETLTLAAQADRTLSLFAWTEVCEGVCISGVHYPLTNGRLTRDFPLGVSNQIETAQAEITCGSGILLVMQSMI